MLSQERAPLVWARPVLNCTFLGQPASLVAYGPRIASRSSVSALWLVPCMAHSVAFQAPSPALRTGPTCYGPGMTRTGIPIGPSARMASAVSSVDPLSTMKNSGAGVSMKGLARIRRHSTIGNVGPAKFEEMDQTQAAQSTCPLLRNKAKLPRETRDG